MPVKLLATTTVFPDYHFRRRCLAVLGAANKTVLSSWVPPGDSVSDNKWTADMRDGAMRLGTKLGLLATGNASPSANPISDGKQEKGASTAPQRMWMRMDPAAIHAHSGPRRIREEDPRLEPVRRVAGTGRPW